MKNNLNFEWIECKNCKDPVWPAAFKLFDVHRKEGPYRGKCPQCGTILFINQNGTYLKDYS